jgi:hypothetical protein
METGAALSFEGLKGCYSAISWQQMSLSVTVNNLLYSLSAVAKNALPGGNPMFSK